LLYLKKNNSKALSIANPMTYKLYKEPPIQLPTEKPAIEDNNILKEETKEFMKKRQVTKVTELLNFRLAQINQTKGGYILN
jgi:adenine deaminase